MASRELLSAHKTVATFDGLTEQKCFHRTALCPDQCDHGGTIATFSIQKVVEILILYIFLRLIYLHSGIISQSFYQRFYTLITVPAL